MDAIGSGARVIALVGPAGAGKTSLAEALLHAAGAIPRLGSVDAGTSQGDASPEGRARGGSTELNFHRFDWAGDDYVLLDCPGSIGLAADTDCALDVADLALVVITPETERAVRVRRQADRAGTIEQNVIVPCPAETVKIKLGRAAPRPRFRAGVPLRGTGVNRSEPRCRARRVQQGLRQAGLPGPCRPDERDSSRAAADGIHVPLLGCSRPEVQGDPAEQDDRWGSKGKIRMAARVTG